MICPTCNGQKEIPVWNRRVPTIPCINCHATGQINDHYPIWRLLGEQLQQARCNRNETLRDFCKRTGENPDTRSRMERGLIDPIDKYGELKKG